MLKLLLLLVTSFSFTHAYADAKADEARIRAALKKNNPQIPWTLIKGMRNRLIHEYFGTDLQLVWNVIKNELPALKTELQRIHSSLTVQHR